MHQALTEEHWEKIHTAFTEAEAHLITGILTGEGVTWRVRSRRVPQLPLSHGLLGATEIYVPKADAPEAQRILMIYRNHWTQDDADGWRTSFGSSSARRGHSADMP